VRLKSLAALVIKLVSMHSDLKTVIDVLHLCNFTYDRLHHSQLKQGVRDSKKKIEQSKDALIAFSLALLLSESGDV
jgi:hypothetical protein